VRNEPSFGRQAVYLDGRYSDPAFDHADPATWEPGMEALRAMGVNIIAPPIWMLLSSNPGASGHSDSEIVPSVYAQRAKQAGLDIITWSFERAGPLANGGGWYYQTVNDVINNDGDRYFALDVLARQVGVRGVFSDWPASVTYYANCMGLD
jgi:glycerophosphoryl diester phosphodiesterase